MKEYPQAFVVNVDLVRCINSCREVCNLVYDTVKPVFTITLGLVGHYKQIYSLSTGKDHESVASIVTSAVGTSDHATPDE